MLALLVVCLTAALVLAGPADAFTSPRSPSGTVFVTERGLNPGSVTAFDAATGRPIWTAQTGMTPIGVVKPRRVPQGLHV